MPVMEAMSVGVPVVVTSCGAMPELLGDGRGLLMDTEYSMIDPWGNSRRDFPNTLHAVGILEDISQKLKITDTIVANARQYMESRTWDFPIEQVNRSIRELLDAKI